MTNDKWNIEFRARAVRQGYFPHLLADPSHFGETVQPQQKRTGCGHQPICQQSQKTRFSLQSQQKCPDDHCGILLAKIGIDWKFYLNSLVHFASRRIAQGRRGFSPYWLVLLILTETL